MTTKLTLSVNEEIVKKAKRIAQNRGKSVSKIIEEFIDSLPEKEPEEKFSIREISNMLKEKTTLPKDTNYKELIRENRWKDYENKKRR